MRVEQTHHCALNSGRKIPTSASAPSGTLSQWVGFALLHGRSRLCTSSILARASLCLMTRPLQQNPALSMVDGGPPHSQPVGGAPTLSP